MRGTVIRLCLVALPCGYAAAEDAIIAEGYGPTLDEIGGPAPDGERYLGTALDLSLEWTPDAATSFFVGYTHHQAGDSLTHIGGGDVDYLQGEPAA